MPEYNQIIFNPQQLWKINIVNLILQKKKFQWKAVHFRITQSKTGLVLRSAYKAHNIFFFM